MIIVSGRPITILFQAEYTLSNPAVVTFRTVAAGDTQTVIQILRSDDVQDPLAHDHKEPVFIHYGQHLKHSQQERSNEKMATTANPV